MPFSNQPIFTENKRFWLAAGIWFWRFLVSVSVFSGTMDRFIKNKYIEKLFWYSWYIVIGLSVSAEYLFGPFPPNFFSNDQNWLNQKMVKWGWGWTLYSVITFSIFINLADQNIMVWLFSVTVLFTSPTIRSVFLAKSKKLISRNVFRLELEKQKRSLMMGIRLYSALGTALYIKSRKTFSERWYEFLVLEHSFGILELRIVFCQTQPEFWNFPKFQPMGFYGLGLGFKLGKANF